MMLAHELVVAPASTPTRTAFFVHGILGSGGNLRGLARKFVSDNPNWQAALIDLRAHGRSLEPDGRPDTIATAASDLAETASSFSVGVTALIGHSLGGKVVLEASRLMPLDHVASLDSPPGIRTTTDGVPEVYAVMRWIHSHPGPWPTRDAFIADFLESAAPEASLLLGQWLAMNLVPQEAGQVWRIQVNRMESLLASYQVTDCWPAIAEATARVHLVIGAYSKAYSPEDRRRAEELAQREPKSISFSSVRAGHWVHTGDPDGVLLVLNRELGTSNR